MKRKIKNTLISLKDTLNETISPHKQKIIGAATTVPLVAVSTMTGVCAASCPYGIYYCPSPGQCRRYTDLNGNGQCDLSLSEVNAQTSISTGSSSQTSTQDTSTTSSHSSSSGSSSKDSSSVSSSSGGDDIQAGSSDPTNASATIQDPSSEVGGTTGNEYHILPVSILLIGAYFFTHYLFAKGILKPRTHKRLWNLLLLGGSLGASITGVLLVFMINLSVGLAYREGLAYWHVELALLMVIVTLIHFHIYKKPFKNMFKVLFGFKSNSEKKDETKSINMSK